MDFWDNLDDRTSGDTLLAPLSGVRISVSNFL
jgi:hypothetical protein